jgi:AraC-like DNA-binding protein
MPNKSTALPSVISMRRKFSDLDEFGEAIVGWDVDLRQLETGSPDLSIELLATPNVIIQHFHIPYAIHQRGLTPAGFTTFGLVFGESRLSWANRESSDAMLVDFNDPNGYDGASGPGFRGIAISVSNKIFSRYATLMGLQATSFIGSGQAYARSGSEEKLNHLQRYLRFLCGQYSAALDPQDSSWLLTELETEVPIQLLAGLVERQEPLESPTLQARQKGLRLAMKFIDENAHDNPLVPDICNACNLSWRSLDRAFKEHYGIGPKRYLLQLRLIRVRQQLKKAPADAKISDIANIWGFWHMGDFAQKYRTLFGEYPSEQLIKLH